MIRSPGFWRNVWCRLL